MLGSPFDLQSWQRPSFDKNAEKRHRYIVTACYVALVFVTTSVSIVVHIVPS